MPADGNWTDYLSLRSADLRFDRQYLTSLSYHSRAVGGRSLIQRRRKTSLCRIRRPAPAICWSLRILIRRKARATRRRSRRQQCLRLADHIHGAERRLGGDRCGSAPASVIAGDTFPVSFTVKNLGTDAAGASWYDQVYFSKSSRSRCNAVRWAAFRRRKRRPAGRRQLHAIPERHAVERLGRAGYLLFVANGNQSIGNRSHEQRLRRADYGQRADLTMTTAAGTARPRSSETTSHRPELYRPERRFSARRMAIGTMRFTFPTSRLTTIPPCSPPSWNRPLRRWPPAPAMPTVSISSCPPCRPAPSICCSWLTRAGAIPTSGSTRVGRRNGAGPNNVYALPITLSLPQVDLAVSNLAAPASLSRGQVVPVSFDVTNQGTESAATSWTDGIYFSTQPTFDKNQATLVDSFPAGQSPLAAGASYTLNENLSIPSLPLGSGYLLFVTNIYSDQAETDHGANNVVAVPVTVGAPDLAATAAGARAPRTRATRSASRGRCPTKALRRRRQAGRTSSSSRPSPRSITAPATWRPSTRVRMPAWRPGPAIATCRMSRCRAAVPSAPSICSS